MKTFALLTLLAFPLLAEAREPTPQEKAHELGTIIAASTETPDAERSLADILEELVLSYSKLDRRLFSPLMVERVIVSPQLSDEMRKRLVMMLSTALSRVPDLQEVACFNCENVLRSRIQDGNWQLSLGATDRDASRSRAAALGAKSFLIVALEIDGEGALVLDATLFSAETGELINGKRITGDAQRAALERDPKELQPAEKREAELLKTYGRHPFLAQAVQLGFLRIPYVLSGDDGAINGLSLGYRLAEVFGPGREWLVGLQLQAFLDPALRLIPTNPLPVSGGLVTIVFAYTLRFQDLRIPLFRAGVNAGGYVGGSLGNSFAAGGVLEIMMRFRLGLNLSLMYILPVNLQSTLNIPLTVGGVTFSVGTSFNWD